VEEEALAQETLLLKTVDQAADLTEIKEQQILQDKQHREHLMAVPVMETLVE
jgi:hypothetical protein